MSNLAPMRMSGGAVDLAPRIRRTTTVAGSPAAAAETVIATLTLPEAIAIASGILLTGFAAFTVGGSGTAANLRIRQTDTSGTIIAATGATTRTAGNLVDQAIQGFDTAGVLPGQVYVLTLTITAGAATSTVSAVCLSAIIA